MLNKSKFSLNQKKSIKSEKTFASHFNVHQSEFKRKIISQYSAPDAIFCKPVENWSCKHKTKQNTPPAFLSRSLLGLHALSVKSSVKSWSRMVKTNKGNRIVRNHRMKLGVGTKSNILWSAIMWLAIFWRWLQVILID